MTSRDGFHIALTCLELPPLHITALVRLERLLLPWPLVVVLRFLYDFEVDVADVAFVALVNDAAQVDV